MVRAAADHGIPGERHRRAAARCRLRGGRGVSFWVAVSGVHATLERAPGNAFAAGFGVLALARRRRRRR